jgi:hypothetical protein
MAVVWLRKCPGLSVGQQSQTAKVPKVTSAPSARIYRLTPSLARLPVPLFLATYTGYTATCYRTAIAQRSTDRRHFKAGHYLLVFSALVSVSIYRRELSYKHAAQIYHQLGSQRRQGLRNWQHLETSRHGTELCGSDSTGHLGGTRRVLCDFKVIV